MQKTLVFSDIQADVRIAQYNQQRYTYSQMDTVKSKKNLNVLHTERNTKTQNDSE
ncbi:hypothetical protein CLOHYLEM_05102 [[Clostridium] hylemonae DSM 15053]|uniref:Uncharacterized protein n=1 Tax=[Clostridium] hylemonae DSM 15053 TaxID=553973 RepID=C0BZ63_9FIRM|nr:hypothetical protein CLOHYLEM_05102 [[Clostridium] hylemonae DSM 15053]